MPLMCCGCKLAFKVYLMFLNLPNVELWPRYRFGEIQSQRHGTPLFDILSQGLTRATAVIYQGSGEREGIGMREVR
jgi:hypothetical protein